MPSSLWALSFPVSLGLAYLPRFVAIGLIMQRTQKFVSHAHPRQQLASKELAMKDSDGLVQRMVSAHNNSLEIAPFWIGAVLLAHAAGLPEETLNLCAKAFMASRALYIPVYAWADTTNKAFVRSVVWLVGLGSVLYLMTAAVSKLSE